MYGLWLYKEFKTEYGYCKLEIFRKEYTGNIIEIGAIAGNSLVLSLENMDSVTSPIGKSVCKFDIIDTQQISYDDFFTPNATFFKVVVSTRLEGSIDYTPRWSGYITPDFFSENLTYRTPISISARDNIGYLNDVDFDLTASTITVRELIRSAFKRIAEDYPMNLLFVTQKQTAGGILAIDAIISTALLREMSWSEVLETILHDLGLQMRWVDNNTIAVLDLSQIPEYYASQSFNFVGASGFREIVPAWRQLSQEQDYGLRENFFEGWLREDNMTFVKEEVVTDAIGRESRIKLYAPNNWQVSGNTYTINLANYRSINRIDGFTLSTLTGVYREIPFKGFENRIFFTGTKKKNTDYNSYMGYRMPIYSGQSPLEITFKALNTYLIPQDDTLHIYNPIDDIIFADSSIPSVQLGIKLNILLHSGVNTYILKEEWEQLTSAETDSITFILDKIGGIEPYRRTTDYDKEQELSISIHSIPIDGELEIRIYGYFIESAEGGGSNYEEIATQYVTFINDITYAYVNKDDTGQSALIGVNDTHNIKQSESYKIGQVVYDRGNINAFAGGLYYPANTPNPLYPMRGFQRNVDAPNYNLLELVGREIIHYNKRNYNRLSGTIRDLNKEPLMFNRLFAREGKMYAPYNYSLNVISNEMNITSMQEVEPYVTAELTEIHSEITTGGGSTVGGGNNIALQYSSDVGNAKRIYELDNASEDDVKGAYIVVDKVGLPEAKKFNLQDIVEMTDWFTLRTLADGKKVLHSKYGIATDAEISIGGISEDIEDDDSGSYSRLDSWDDYNPANGDVLSAVLGYGLKIDIQSLQEQINNMGGGGLSSVTVKIGNTAYDSVDGIVSLPSYPVVPTLLSEFTDDVVAGHYLPIEGGYFANSLNYKSTSAYPLILGSTASAEQSVILLRHNDVDKAQVGWSSSLGTYLYNTASKAKLGINNNGVAYFNDYTLYHTGNFDPADYLPKSGGVITSASYQPFILHRTEGGYAAPFVVFENDDKRLGMLGISAVTAEPVFYRDSSTSNPFTILHSGNVADYALPLSGGTITDQLYFPPTSKYISLRKYGSYNAGIGYDTAGDESVVLWASVKFTRLRWHAGLDLTDGITAGSIMNITPDFEISKKSGEAVGYIAGNTIIHSGNIGDQSVAKARSLYDFGVISTAFNANTSLSGGGKQSNYDNIALWGDSVPSGMQYGMIYQLQGYYQDGNALAGQLAWDVNHLGEDSTRNLWWRANDSTGFANAKWHQIAFTDSNVASATKLQTARTLWGWSFDGTQDLSGALTIANNAGGINIKDTAGTSRSVVELNAGNNLFFGWSTAGAGYHSYYCGNVLMFLSGTSRAEVMRILPEGNILIGTITNNGNKLQVNGNISATGSLTIGGATLTWDATYNCLRVNTNLATDGELTAGGVSDAAVVTEYDSATEIAELNRRITELENRLAAYEQ